MIDTPEGRSRLWSQVWPGAAAAAAIWGVFFTLVIGPLQRSDEAFDRRITYNDGRFVELYAFKAAALEWEQSHDREMERLRGDLSAAILTSSRSVDRLNDRLDILHNDLQRLIERRGEDDHNPPYKGKGAQGG